MQDLDVSAGTRHSVQITPATYTTAQQGDGVDAHLFRSAIAVIDVDTWTDGEHAFAIEESDDDDVWTAVPAGRLSGTVPTVEDDTLDGTQHTVGVLATKSFLRIVTSVDDVSDGAAYGAYLILANARR